MARIMEEFIYTFGDLVFTGRRPRNRSRTTWYLRCTECGKRHMFGHTGTKIWHTSCQESGVEWTITPAEYYILRPADFSKVLSDI